MQESNQSAPKGCRSGFDIGHLRALAHSRSPLWTPRFYGGRPTCQTAKPCSALPGLTMQALAPLSQRSPKYPVSSICMVRLAQAHHEPAQRQALHRQKRKAIFMAWDPARAGTGFARKFEAKRRIFAGRIHFARLQFKLRGPRASPAQRVAWGDVTSPVEGQAIPRYARRKQKYRPTERQAVFLFTPSAALFLFAKDKKKKGGGRGWEKRQSSLWCALVTFSQEKVT